MTDLSYAIGYIEAEIDSLEGGYPDEDDAEGEMTMRIESLKSALVMLKEKITGPGIKRCPFCAHDAVRIWYNEDGYCNIQCENSDCCAMLVKGTITNNKEIIIMEYKKYRRTNIAEMRPYENGEVLPSWISVSDTDLENGSPKVGDMIARNPNNHKDQWLVSATYFMENFEEQEGDNMVNMKKLNELKKVIALLEANGWTHNPSDSDEYTSFLKHDAVGIDVSYDRIVFIGESGDFADIPLNYYALLGYVYHHRLLHPRKCPACPQKIL